METLKAPRSTHQIEGEFLGFIAKSGGELKYIQVQVGERIFPIKLAKELRETLGQKLVEGDRLSVLLEQTGSGLGSKIKLKTHRVERLGNGKDFLVVESASKSEDKQKGKILLCYKSGCSKRGGRQLYRALIEALQHLGLQNRVTVELTGCQKQCKNAPNLILMPGQVKHAYVNPNDLVPLIKAHYLPTH